LKIWYIYGAGGLGRECLDVAHSLTKFKNDEIIFEFLEDSPKLDKINDTKISSFDEHEKNSWVTIAVGEPELRKKLREKISKTSLSLRSLISPFSFISPHANIESGAVIAPLCSIQANATIRENVLVNTMCIVGHDCEVCEDSVLSSKVNLGGAVSIQNNSFIGMGAMIKENISIGSNSIIGMSSVVYRDIIDDVIAIGNPARVSKKNTEKKVFSSKKVNKH